MISEHELSAKIEQVTKDYKGQLDHLQAAIGLMMIGRVMGWRVVRLVCSRSAWTDANNLFGDVKTLLPAETEFSDKSMAYRVVKASGQYWEYVKGHVAALPLQERRTML